LHPNPAYVGPTKTPLYIKDPTGNIEGLNTPVPFNTDIYLFSPVRNKYIGGGRQNIDTMLKFIELDAPDTENITPTFKLIKTSDVSSTDDILITDSFYITYQWDETNTTTGDLTGSDNPYADATNLIPWYFKNEFDGNYNYALTTNSDTDINNNNLFETYDGFKEYEPDIVLRNQFENGTGNVNVKFEVTDLDGVQSGASAIALEPSGNEFSMKFYVKSGSEPIQPNDAIFTLENEKRVGINAPIYTTAVNNTIDICGNLTIDGTIKAKKEEIDTVIYNTVNVENALLMSRFFDANNSIGNEGRPWNFLDGPLSKLLTNNYEEPYNSTDTEDNTRGFGVGVNTIKINGRPENDPGISKTLKGDEYLFMSQDNIGNLTGKNNYSKIESNVNNLRDIVSNAASNGLVVQDTSGVTITQDMKFNKLYIYINTSVNGDDESPN
jgi:hypothetical protein